MINICENTLSFRRKDSAPLSSQDENSLQIEKVTDSKSSDSIKDFLINELKEIEEPENLDNTKKKISKTNNITFSLEDKDESEEDSTFSIENEDEDSQEKDSKHINVFMPRFRGTEQYNNSFLTASLKLKNYVNYQNSLWKSTKFSPKKLSIPLTSRNKYYSITENSKFSDRKYSYVKQSLNLQNKIHISNLFTMLKQ